MSARADYTVGSGANINASTITGQSGVLTINGKLTLSSNVNLSGFSSVVINAPNGQIYWSNNSDLTFPAGTSLDIQAGAPGLQSNGNNGSQRLIIGETIIAVSSTHSNNSPFDFIQINQLGGLPEYTTSNNINVCAGTAISAFVTPAKFVSGVTYTFTWSVSPSPGTFTYNSDHTIASIYLAIGNYTITCIASANNFDDTIKISATVNSIPAKPVPSSNTPVCAGSNINLSAATVLGATYTWTGPGFSSTTQNPTIPGTTTAMTGTYNVTVKSAAGCSSPAGSTTVSVNSVPSATISYPGTPFCTSITAVQAVTRTGTSGGTYSVSPPGLSINSGTGAITPSASTAGTYTVTYTMASSGGCSAQTATTSVTITTLPSATISYPGTPFCKSITAVQSVSQTGTSGGIYSASPVGLSINSGTGAITPSASTAGTYTITYTMAASGGCALQTASAALNIASTPSVPVATSNSPVCFSNPINLTTPAITGATYSWSGPGGFNSTSQSPVITNANNGKAGIYSVTVTSSAGCSSSPGTVSVSINAAYSSLGSTIVWGDITNWCPGLPNSLTNISIPLTTNNPIIPTGTRAIVNNITIASGATLTVNGTLEVVGTITNNGTIDATNGTIEMNGSSAQTISGSLFYHNTVKNLVVSNTAGLSVSSTAGDTLKISGGLTFGDPNASLNTGDNIDLLSTPSQTAYLGVVEAANTITGKAIVDRYINIGTGSSQHAKSWQFLTVPTTGQTIKQSWMENGNNDAGYGIWLTGPGGTVNGFDASSPGVAIKTYNPTTDKWDAVSTTGNTIHNMEGYMVFIRGDRTVNGTTVTTAKPTVLRSNGTLITGNQPAISVAPDHYQSIGNPYPSPIDFAKLSRVDGVDELFYAWDPYLNGTYGYGGYQTLSATNDWVPVPGGTTPYPAGVANSTIQSGQAFFVHATSTNCVVAQKPTISISEISKVNGISMANFARNASRNASPERQFLRTDLFMSPDPGAPIADGNAVAFDNSFSNKVDGYDALKMINSGENFGLKRDGKTLAVEAKAPLTYADTIFYNMTNMKTQTYQLRIIPVNMQSDNLQALLLDKFLNTSTTLSLSDTNLVNFSATGNAASKAVDRFSIVFRQMAALPVTLTSIKALLLNNEVRVEWTTQNESGMSRYEVEKSTDGARFHFLSATDALNKGAERYQTIDTQPSVGNNYYRVRIVSKDGTISYSQIMKVNFGKIIPVLEVAPNPILSGTIHLIFINEPVGIYQISLTNLLGQEIVSKTILHTARNASETISGDSINKGVYQLSITKPGGSHEVIKVVY